MRTHYSRVLRAFLRAELTLFVLALLFLAGPAEVCVLAQASQTIQITATNPDGTNTGTARLGVPVTFASVVSAGTANTRSWTLQGGGTIKTSGTNNMTLTYTPPLTMPTDPGVTITAYLTAAPSVTTSYTLTLINAVPTLTKASPSQLPSGTTTSVTLTGTGFTAGTVLSASPGTVTTSYQSPTSLIAQVTLPIGVSGNVTLTPQNPSPGGGAGTALQAQISAIQLTATNTDGDNSGSARLGSPVSVTTVVSGASASVRAWTLQGAGTFKSSGTNNMNGIYTPPSTMPANPNVTLTSYLSSAPLVTTTYSFTLVNPVPSVTAASPVQLLTGSTQTVSLTGSGFVAGVGTTLNGAPLATTFIDYNHASVQVPVAANASGALNLQISNPGPGGGSFVFAEPVAGNGLTLSATDQNGNSTTTIGLGNSVNFTASVSGTAQTAVTWTDSGPGVVSSSGVYTAPTTMPSPSVVTITATLVSNTSVTATYQLNIVNPVPSIASVSPAQIPSGATTAVTITGSGFTTGTALSISPGTVTTTYQSPTSLLAQVTLAAGVTGNLSVTPQNAAPGGGSGTAFQAPISTILLTATNSDGTNTGTARLGVPVTVTEATSGSPYSVMAWTLNGAGSIKSSGTNNSILTYTPPATMPSSAAVSIVGYLSSNPSVTTTYSLTLVNPIPSVTTASPTKLLLGSTQTLTLSGAGFVPGTVITLNGNSLATTYIDYNDASVQVPVAANASGSLNLTVANPAPGGGSSSFAEPLAGSSMTLSAADQNGNSTTTVGLGNSVTLTPTITGSAQTAVTWADSGPGVVSSSGVYTAPTTMPSPGVVTITATLTSNTSITATYQLTIVNPVPSIASVSPAQIPSGATTAVTITGSGFTSGTALSISSGTVTTTYQSPTSLLAQVTLAAGVTGNLNFTPQNAAPGGGAGTAFQAPISTILLTATNSDGTNTGTARLGVPVTISSSVSGSPYAVMAWTLNGGGTIKSSGTNNSILTYTPPATMPSGASASIVGYLNSNPSVTTTYTVALINPVPTVTTASPTKLLTGSTQTVTLAGAGFLPSTVVILNGTSLATTYIDYNDVTVQVPVAANATGTLSLLVQNPAPGGGSGSTFTETVSSSQLTVTANDTGGNPITSVALGKTVTLAAAVTGSAQTTVNWTVTGAGSISTGGVYTAPSTFPSSNTVTITATLASNTTISGSYQLTINNPLPVISKLSPTQIPSGTTTSVTITGTGFVPGTVLAVSPGTVTTTYQSATTLVAQVTIGVGVTGNISLTPQNPSPGGGTGAAYSASISTILLTATNPDGVNTGSVRLGVPMVVTEVTSGSSYAVMAWTLQGAGTIKSSSTNNSVLTYTPPQTMPANPSVVITGYLNSNQVVTTSYAFTLLNPVPTVTTASPTQLLSGATQTVSLVGSGFVAGTVVKFNGQTLPTTYTNYTHASVQVPVPGNASGNLSLQVQNPSPGGGGGSTFTETVPTNTITVTATDQNGNSTTTVPLGYIVNFAATVSGSSQTAVNWSESGAGSIDNNGVYTAPQTLPTNTVSIVTAALASNPALTTTYQLNIVNPLPVITSSNPILIPSGATTSVTLTGTGFVPNTTLSISNGTITTTYQSSTTLVASVTVPAGATGNLQITPQSPAPGGGAGPFYLEAVAAPVSVTAAARLLDQTTFGPTTDLITHVQQEGLHAWLTEQFNTPPTVMPIIPVNYPSYCGDAQRCALSELWQTMLTGNDQLRQRVAFALSQLWVVAAPTVTGQANNAYMNMLANDAFGNWYNVMNDVTLSPTMGVYLDMLYSKVPTTGAQIADENYARELMQLFNLGLYLLNQDGTLQLDTNGNPIPTYTEAQVQAFAKVFTGYVFAASDCTLPTNLSQIPPNYYCPMVPVEHWHDQSAKTLLNGTVLPAGQTAEQDLAGALTNVFNHPNLPPFISKQLIQHLVTGNPSPAYVARVAAVFTDDGNHVRGNMAAVLTAILTDPEARAGDSDTTVDGGHLREPVLWMTGIMRGLGFVNVDPNNFYNRLSDYSSVLGEMPYQSPNVFNFFPPSYVIPGTTINSPEFGLENTGSISDRLSLADTMVNNHLRSFNVDLSATSTLGQIATSSANLVDALGVIFMHGAMETRMRTAIINEVNTIPLSNIPQRVRIATYLVITSSQYKIMH